MASLNKVFLIGNLGKDPETRYTQSGEAVCNVNLATTEKWTDKKTNEKKEETEWHRVTAFGRLAEIIGEYCKKGSPLYVEGKLKTRKWTDKENVERYTTEIHAYSVQLLGQKGDHGESEPAPKKEKPAKPAEKKVSQDDLDDDIPF